MKYEPKQEVDKLCSRIKKEQTPVNPFKRYDECEIEDEEYEDDGFFEWLAIHHPEEVEHLKSDN